MDLEEFSEYRRQLEEIRAQLCLRYPLASLDNWLTRTSDDPDANWVVAFSYVCLPTLGEQISACLTITADARSAYVSWEHRWDLFPDPKLTLDEHTVGFASGRIVVAQHTVTKLKSACEWFWDIGGGDVPSKCYDGTPVSLKVTATPFTESKTGSCNLGDPTQHPTCLLASLVVPLLGCAPSHSINP